MFRALPVLMLTIAVAFLGVSFARPVQAQDDAFQQIQLTEAQIKGYLAAQKQLDGYLDKIEKAGDTPDAKLIEGLEALAKKHGFASFEELDSVISNISFVLSGFDQESGDFREPRDAMAAEIELLKKDRQIPEKERKVLMEELKEAIQTTPKLKFQGNTALVKKYFKQLDQALN